MTPELLLFLSILDNSLKLFLLGQEAMTPTQRTVAMTRWLDFWEPLLKVLFDHLPPVGAAKGAKG
jgi:hypothetical protein